METWIVIFIFGLIFFVAMKMIFMRLKFFNHRFSLMLTFLIILFLIVGFLIAIAGNNIDLTTKEGVKSGFKLYFTWLGNSMDNIKVITSNAIKMDWSANNTSFE